MEAKFTEEEHELLSYVQDCLLACYKAVTCKGDDARVLVETSVDIKAVGDLTANKAIVEYFRKSGLPVIIYAEELEKPEKLSSNPKYSVIADDLDGTRNYAL